MKTGITYKSIAQVDADCIAVGIVEEKEQSFDIFARFGDPLKKYLESQWDNGKIKGKELETTYIHTLNEKGPRTILLVGLGKRENITFENVRAAAGRAVKEVLKHNKNGLERFVLSLWPEAGEKLSAERMAHAMTEGAFLAQYRFSDYKQNSEENPQIKELVLWAPRDHQNDAEKGIVQGAAYARGTNLARDLVNTPGNLLPPAVLAERAVDVARRHGMEVEVLDEKEMKKMNMGALLAVAQGSEQPPRMVIVKYQGREKWDNVLGLIGKGITFDTGGISLKPVQNMEEMVSDMGGAAAVIGALETIGLLKPEVNILVVLPMAENMPSGKAYRPGDVITSMSGKTIEIVTTDAEGRLILADAITYARRQGVEAMVDLATLTGAVLVALGTHTTAAMTNNEEWVEQVLEAAADAGELMWRLPTFDVYKKQYKGRVADLRNAGGRNAGSITAGMFLGEFAEDTPWVHLDIAGTAWAEENSDLSPRGGTGVMVRTLTRLALNLSNNS